MYWKKGDICYFIENNVKVTKALVISIQGNFCTIKFNGGAICLRNRRLYRSSEEAAEHIPDRPKSQRRRHDPYLYDH
jgi:hypothetical protein